MRVKAHKMAQVREPSRFSRLLLRWFSSYSRRFTRRHFNAFRISREGLPTKSTELPLVVFLNHASWWDPLVGLLLARRFFPSRNHHAPMDAESLRTYRFFEKLGFFGVELGTRRGAARFLRVAEEICSRPRTALWITPQGRFCDVRERPPGLRQGLGYLANRVRKTAFLPLAIEYSFWEARLPEILVRFGEPVLVESGGTRSAGEWTALFESRLAFTQDALAADSCKRRVEAFEVLLSGRRRVGSVYDFWLRLTGR